MKKSIIILLLLPSIFLQSPNLFSFEMAYDNNQFSRELPHKTFKNVDWNELIQQNPDSALVKINQIMDRSKREEFQFLESTGFTQRQKNMVNQIQRERNQRNIFAGGFLAFLLFSGIIFRQFKLTQQARKRSDELLLNILPQETTNELKEYGFTTARNYENVSVLLSDFVGFTKLSEKLSPHELVQEIDFYFKSFDQITEKYGLEKIKTIGDAYLATGGLSQGNGAQTKKTVLAALEMQKLVEIAKAERMEAGRPFLDMRIGINTGPVVAGVVGHKKFQYDIWGDTVNTTARMEQSCMAGQVNISQSTFDAIKNEPGFTFFHRGKIEAKNKGMLDMYFISLN